MPDLVLRPENVTELPLASLPLPEWAGSALAVIAAAAREGRTVTIESTEETFTPEEMAREIGISRAGVQRRIQRGEIAHRKHGNRYRIPRTEVERFRAAYIKDMTAALADDF
ncbi:helix-turn-helix domain-containing protein [Mycolicibacterium sp. J2]|uniref:helix-turn-helix domain-containing protein n=1 Tax=Mycolicibacterium sp. J2 TaxID=2993511 RepID=UPI00224B8C66|nr:helix-turn-helix domain-containing protein [Mycolicibacterium sp. J2]MCX2711271.1 helix-turn-helix domain-containing protein [Mycolicibacterium sp. J2]